AVDKLKEWTPKAPKGYAPGYDFTDRLSEKDALEATKGYRTDYVRRLSDLSTLLENADYFAAFQVVQSYTSADDEKRPSKEEFEKASARMKTIEKDKGVKGLHFNEDENKSQNGDR